MDRVRVVGSVTLCESGRAIYIQDASGAVKVPVQANFEELPMGALVDVIGFPGPIVKPPILEDAVIVDKGTVQMQLPVRISSEDLLSGAFNNRLAEVDVRFLGQTDTPSGGKGLAVQADHLAFIALPATDWSKIGLPSLEPGSKLRLVGVCTSPGDPADPFSSSLLLRSPEDITLIRSPASTHPLVLPVLASTALVSGLSLVAALVFIRKQRLQTDHMLRVQSALQEDMRQSELQLRRSAEEKDRIGRDLHDDIIQSIYSAGLSLEDCRRIFHRSPERAEARISAAIS